MTYQFTGGQNVHVAQPVDDLVIGYSRLLETFPLQRYVQIRPVNFSTDLYRQVTTEDAGRVIDNDENLWEDGGDRPRTNRGGEQFRWLSYRTKRRNFDFTVGYLEKNQADFAVIEEKKAAEIQRAMTDRTHRVHKVLSDDSNWEASHIIDVTAIPGNTGAWDASTVDLQNIKRSLNVGYDSIRKATLGAVTHDQLRLVINPVTAARIGETAEIVNHIKSSPDAYSQVAGQSGKWSRYGLPNRLYGYEVVVEDTVRTSSRIGAATTTKVDVMADGVGYLISRVGSLLGLEGSRAASFSSVSLFMLEQLNIESFDDAKNRRFEGNIVEDYDVKLTSSAASVKLTNLLT